MARAAKNDKNKSGQKETKKVVLKKSPSNKVQKSRNVSVLANRKKGKSEKAKITKKPTAACKRKLKSNGSKQVVRFRQRAIIDEDDLLSRLPLDCLNPILFILNQDELDVLSMTSQKFYAATVYARPKAIKRKFANLTISQVDSYKTLVVIGKPDLRPRMSRFHRAYAVRLDRATDCYETYFSDQPTLLEAPVRQYAQSSTLQLSLIVPLHRKVRDRLIPLLERLAFDSYSFDAIGIDEQFLHDFKNIGPLQSLKFERCAFDSKFNEEAKSRFLSFILDAKPSSLTLDFPRKEERHTFDENFILSYAKSVQFPGLILAENMLKYSISVTQEMVSVFARFHEINAVSLSIAPDHLLDMILKRLDVCPLEGRWRLTVTGGFTEEMMDRIDTNVYTRRYGLIEREGRTIEAHFHIFMERYSFIAKVMFLERGKSMSNADYDFLGDSQPF